MRAGIGLGSNLGNRLENLTSAMEAVRALSTNYSSDRVSSIYETSPVDCDPNTPNFLNAAMEIEYAGDPLTLLNELQSLEARAGRPDRRPKNSPRTLDLDLLYVGDLTLNHELLVLPHPLIYLRQFVLKPLSEISPDRILPGQQISFREALQMNEFDNTDIIRLYNQLV